MSELTSLKNLNYASVMLGKQDTKLSDVDTNTWKTQLMSTTEESHISSKCLLGRNYKKWLAERPPLQRGTFIASAY